MEEEDEVVDLRRGFFFRETKCFFVRLFDMVRAFSVVR